MRDYDGDMNYFQDQLTKAGITKEMVDMTNYCGLTFRELQGIVNRAIAINEQRKKESKNQ